MVGNWTLISGMMWESRFRLKQRVSLFSLISEER
jgi:hypothetical protein